MHLEYDVKMVYVLYVLWVCVNQLNRANSCFCVHLFTLLCVVE